MFHRLIAATITLSIILGGCHRPLSAVASRSVTEQASDDAPEKRCDSVVDATITCNCDDVDCQLYGEPNGATSSPKGIAAPPPPKNRDDRDAWIAWIDYSIEVSNLLSRRLERAKELSKSLSTPVELDYERISEAERQVVTLFSDLVDEFGRPAHPRLVVTATRLNVRRHPGDIHKQPISTLAMNEVVYFCGGHPGPTKLDGEEVTWYWIDKEGDCDRSKPKDFVASQETRAGKVHWLVRWHDYDVRYFRYHEQIARGEGRLPDEVRYDTRAHVAKCVVEVEILSITPELGHINTAIKCAGLSIGMHVLNNRLYNGVIDATGGNALNIARLAAFSGSTAGGAGASGLVAAIDGKQTLEDDHLKLALAIRVTQAVMPGPVSKMVGGGVACFLMETVMMKVSDCNP